MKKKSVFQKIMIGFLLVAMVLFLIGPAASIFA